MSFFKKLLPLLLSVGATVVTAASPSLSAAVASHKVLATILASIAFFAHAALPSIFGGPEQVATPR